MTALRATDVRFTRAGIDLVTPFTFSLEAGERYDLVQPTAFAASIAARLCAAIVKPSSGRILIGDFETRLQAPHAKRRIGFVDARGFEGDAHAFACEVAFHADVWGVAPSLARERARRALATLARDDAYARAIALALVADVSVMILDLPAPDVARSAHALLPDAAIVATSVAA